VNPDDTSSLEFVTYPSTVGTGGLTGSLIPDKAAAEPYLQRMKEFSTEPPPPPVAPSEVRVRVLNGSGRSGLAQTVSQQLGDAGFVTAGTGNDERGRVAVTEIRFANGADDKARALIPFIGGSAKLVGDPTLKNTDVTVVLGSDYSGVASAPAGGAATPDPAAAATAAAIAACR